MRVLVSHEYSGTVRDAFIRAGHDAMSLDLLPTDVPGPHHQGDGLVFLESQEDGHFDIIIAHPECTKLCVSGNSTYGRGMPKHHERLKSAEWTYKYWELCKRKGKRVCFENPVGVLKKLTNMPKPQYIQPWQFGHMEQKKTGLFLHNLPLLVETNNVYDGWKIRSTTFKGIAEAMAQQWGIL